MSLYNEVRPQTLSEVKGQDNIKAQLSGMFQSGKVPNALLLVGPRGTGKTTVARIVARFVNCENPTEEPCNECTSCKEILAGTSMDVIELDAASNNSVEDVRKITENAMYAPVGKKKVYILDEVHMFSNGAWNALLKILEEPPANVHFIMCTTEENKVPATIVSRCCKLYFEKINLEVVVAAMKDICDKYGKAYDEDALKLIAKASEGCMRDALSILEAFFDTDSIVTEIVAKTLGLSGEESLFNILEGIQQGDLKKALSAVKEATLRGTSLQKLAKGLMEVIVDAMWVIQGTDINSVLNTEGYRKRLAEFSKSVDMDRCLELTSQISEVYSTLTKTADAQFLLETAIVRTVHYQSELSQLRQRVEKLESGVVIRVPSEGSVEMPSIDEPVETTEDIPNVDNFSTDMDDFIPADDDLPDFEDMNVPSGEPSIPQQIDTPSADDDIFNHLPPGMVVNDSAQVINFEDAAKATEPEQPAQVAEESDVTENKDSDLPAGSTPFFSYEADELPPMDGLTGLLWQ